MTDKSTIELYLRDNVKRMLQMLTVYVILRAQ